MAELGFFLGQAIGIALLASPFYLVARAIYHSRVRSTMSQRTK